MSEVSCHTCQAACCKGPETMELTTEEFTFMTAGGNNFITIAEPANSDRTDVLNPIGVEVDDKSNKLLILASRGQENKPLSAGLGRYILWGACSYLKTSNEGWEYCSVYEDRPAVCRDFEMGSQKCRLMRVLAGIDKPSEEVPDLRDLLG